MRRVNRTIDEKIFNSNSKQKPSARQKSYSRMSFASSKVEMKFYDYFGSHEYYIGSYAIGDWSWPLSAWIWNFHFVNCTG